MNTGKIMKKVMSIFLVILSLVNMLPVTALAANIKAPSEVILKSAEFKDDYISPSFKTACKMHVMSMEIGSEGVHDVFCADHGKRMGTRLINQKWHNPQPFENRTLELLMKYYYTHDEALYPEHIKDTGNDWAWGDAFGGFMNAWVQAIAWRAMGQGDPLTDPATDLATELMYVYNKLNHTHHTDINVDCLPGTSTTYMTAGRNVVNAADNTCEVNMYVYDYGGGDVGDMSANQVQKMLIGIPYLENDEEPGTGTYKIIVKKVDSTNPNKGLIGAQFSLSKVSGGTFSANGVTNSNGICEFDNLPEGTYAITETKAPDGYQIDNAGPEYVSFPQASGSEVTIIFTDTPTTSASGNIRKVDKDNPTHGLAGATISITGTDVTFHGEYQTGASGALEGVPWDTMPVGGYVAEEIGAPAGYILPDPHEKHAFNWDRKNDVHLVFENDSEVKACLVKTDANGKPLAGAVYNVEKDGAHITTAVTDASGRIVVPNVTEGYYDFFEVQAPAGYERNPLPVGLYVSADLIKGGGTAKVTAINHKLKQITVKKEDASNHNAISGVQFDYYWNGQYMGRTNPTNMMGETVISNVASGTYLFEEVNTPPGYSTDKNGQERKYQIEIDCSNEAKTDYKITIYNNPLNKIKVIKTDAATLKPIQGVKFRYYKNSTLLGTTEPTDVNGVTWVEGLDTGTYRFEEVAPAPGYSANLEKHEVYVDCNDFSTLEYHLNVKNYHLKPLTIRKIDAESNLPVAGVVFQYWKDGQYVGLTEPTNERGEIFIPELDTGLYVFKEFSGPPDYMLNPEDYEIYIDCKDIHKDAYILDVLNWEKRTMIIEKIDAITGKPLEGAEFHVTSQDLNYDENFTTDAAGKIVIKHVKDGTYQITETKAPDGYILPEGTKATQTVVLNPGSENTVLITFKDLPKTCIVVHKTDSVTNKPLEGAKFQVSTVAGREIGYITTDATGTAYTSRLEPGVYVVKEVKAPDGYQLDSTPQNAIVETNNATLLYFEDVPMTTITITKLDADTGKPLPGATFIVKDPNGRCATTEGTYTTGPDGTVTTSPVPVGKYFVYETKAPDGYAINEDPTCVYVEAGEKNNAIVKDTKLGAISILKTDMDQRPLAGATFKVESVEGNYIGQFTTDGSGEAFVPHVKPGVYVVTELQAQEGYEIDSTPQNVVVKAGQTAQVIFKDAKKGGLIIHLQDQKDGSDLADGQFTITYCPDNSVVASGVTDQAGIWMVGNLTPGKYIITHTYAAPGYTIVDTEKTEFVVSGQNKDVYFKDCTAGLVVELVDSLTNETVKGGRFQVVRNEDNIVIGEFEGDVDGLALVGRLIPGMYSVKSIVIPDGYVLDGADNQITHVKANEEAHVTFKVTPIVGITIHSVDQDTKAPLAGTKFEVWHQNGELVDTYVTDTTGTVQTNKLAPGVYVIKQIFAEKGYTPVTAEMTVEVKAGVPVVQTFESVALSSLKVISLDQNGKGIPGMHITINKQNGEFVGDYITGIDGSVTVTDLAKGYYVVKETTAPEGFIIKNAEQTILVESTKPAELTFRHDAITGLQIKTTTAQTKLPVAGVEYSITKLNGEKVGTYTSNDQGLVYLTLAPGDYVVTQTKVPDGYTLDSTSRNITVKANVSAEMEFVLTQMSSIRVRIVDGKSNQGIYGVRTLFKTADGTIVGEFTTNNEGYIELTKTLQDGTYTIEMISIPNGYPLDTIPKTIQILNGQTTEITWKCYKEAGQIQIVLTSADMNPITGKPAGSPIQGAEFTVMNADTYAIMDVMKTDVNGVAASHGLPIGRYYVKQSGAAPYYAVNDKQLEIKLKIKNDVVREELTNTSLNIQIPVSLKSNKQVAAGTTMRYDVTAIGNNSTTPLDNFYWHIKVPTDVARIGTVYTGSWNFPVNYRVEYKTNMKDYRVLANNLQSSNRYQYDLSSTALRLQAGEYVTDVRFVFGTVPAGFKLVNRPAIAMYTLPRVFNGYKLIGRIEAGGQYNGYWYTGTSLWTTVVKSGYKYGSRGTVGYVDPTQLMNPGIFNYPTVLPKTGY